MTEFYEDFDDFRNTDMLIILKEDKPVDHDKAFNDLNLNYELSKYNFETHQFEHLSHGDLRVGRYSDALCFDGNRYYFLNTIDGRLRYAYASLHEDNLIKESLKKVLPEIDNIKVPCERYTTKYYLNHWMEKYGFTLEDFLFNDKYIVISDSHENNISKLFDLNLLNHYNIAECSEYEPGANTDSE